MLRAVAHNGTEGKWDLLDTAIYLSPRKAPSAILVPTKPKVLQLASSLKYFRKAVKYTAKRFLPQSVRHINIVLTAADGLPLRPLLELLHILGQSLPARPLLALSDLQPILHHVSRFLRAEFKRVIGELKAIYPSAAQEMSWDIAQNAALRYVPIAALSVGEVFMNSGMTNVVGVGLVAVGAVMMIIGAVELVSPARPFHCLADREINGRIASQPTPPNDSADDVQNRNAIADIQRKASLMRYIIPSFSSYYPVHYATYAREITAQADALLAAGYAEEREVVMSAQAVEEDLMKPSWDWKRGAMRLMPGVAWGSPWEGIKWK